MFDRHGKRCLRYVLFSGNAPQNRNPGGHSRNEAVHVNSTY